MVRLEYPMIFGCVLTSSRGHIEIYSDGSWSSNGRRGIMSITCSDCYLLKNGVSEIINKIEDRLNGEFY